MQSTVSIRGGFGPPFAHWPTVPPTSRQSGEEAYALLGKWVHMLGFRGHFASKSRRYSITLGALRRARRRAQVLIAQHQAEGRPLDLRALEADLLADDADETTLVIGHWHFVGSGWANEAQTVLANAAAARAREYDQWNAQNAGKHKELGVRGQRDGRDRRPALVSAGRQPVPGRPRPHDLRMEERRHRPARTTGWQATAVPASGRSRLGGIAADGDRGMKPMGLGEHGSISITREGGRYVAYLRYRDYAGKGHRVKRADRSKAEASRRVLKAVRDALGAHGEGELNRKSTLDEAARGWLVMFEGLVRRGARSPSTLDEYRHVVDRVVVPGVGSLRLGEVTTPRLDQFVQSVLADRGYATAKLVRSVLSGICGWLVRRRCSRGEPRSRPDAIGAGPGPNGPGFLGGRAASVACTLGQQRVRPAPRPARTGEVHARDWPASG